MKKYIRINKIIAAFFFIFGIATCFMGGAVLFDLFGMRAKEGHYVSFVVLANWICGFIYLIAAYGFWKQKIWTEQILWVAFFLLLITFLGFANHIFLGGQYETKTIYAMSFRTIISLVAALIARYTITKK